MVVWLSQEFIECRACSIIWVEAIIQYFFLDVLFYFWEVKWKSYFLHLRDALIFKDRRAVGFSVVFTIRLFLDGVLTMRCRFGLVLYWMLVWIERLLMCHALELKILNSEACGRLVFHFMSLLHWLFLVNKLALDPISAHSRCTFMPLLAHFGLVVFVRVCIPLI